MCHAFPFVSYLLELSPTMIMKKKIYTRDTISIKNDLKKNGRKNIFFQFFMKKHKKPVQYTHQESINFIFFTQSTLSIRVALVV